jgi:hypothetical protein
MESIKLLHAYVLHVSKNASAHSAPSSSAPTMLRGCRGDEFGSKDPGAELAKFGSNLSGAELRGHIW